MGKLRLEVPPVSSELLDQLAVGGVAGQGEVAGDMGQ